MGATSSAGPEGIDALGLLAAASGYLAAAVFVWRRRRAVGARALTLMLVAVATWTALYGLEIAAGSLDAAGRFGELKYVGIVALGPAWLVFVLQYTGRVTRVRRRFVALLLVHPVLVLGLLAVPATDQLIRYYPAGEQGEAIPFATNGALFWVMTAYSYALLLGATALFVLTLLRLSSRWWRPVTLLTAGALLPFAVNVAYNAEIAFQPVDPTPASFGLMALTLVWGLFRFRLLDLVPVARHAVVDRMSEGLLVLDPLRRVADLNPAACRMLLATHAELVGRPVRDLLPDLPATASDDPVDMSSPLDRGAVWAVTRTEVPRRGTGRPGELIVLRDVSERRRSEQRLTRLLAERTRTAHLLQEALRPEVLPDVPGLTLAVRHVAVGGGDEVGGDFYDLHPRSSGDGWGLVLGDVSGKGSSAAVLATATRFTARTCGSGQRSPREVLGAVNEVVRGHGEDERFCTAIYLTLRTGDTGDLHGQLCLAGHPPALLRRRDGTVEPVGRPGTALGLLVEPELHDVDVVLRPGEWLCLYTDGVVEARRGADAYDEGRLVALLGSATGTAEQLIADLLRDVAAFADAPGRDDLTVLVVGPRVGDEATAADGTGELASDTRPRVHS